LTCHSPINLLNFALGLVCKLSINSGGYITNFELISGLAYDLKTVSLDLVRKRALRTGDGSFENNEKDEPQLSTLWGWSALAITENDKKLTDIY
jgi:hypothetical protein